MLFERFRDSADSLIEFIRTAWLWQPWLQFHWCIFCGDSFKKLSINVEKDMTNMQSLETLQLINNFNFKVNYS